MENLRQVAGKIGCLNVVLRAIAINRSVLIIGQANSSVRNIPKHYASGLSMQNQLMIAGGYRGDFYLQTYGGSLMGKILRQIDKIQGIFLEGWRTYCERRRFCLPRKRQWILSGAKVISS